MAKSKLSPLEQTIHNQFTRYGRNAKEWTRKCAVLLPKVAQHEIWRKRRCHSIYEYAAKVAGMNHDQTREALRVVNLIKDKPELMAMAEKKGINAVRAVATIATKETAKLWANRIEVMSVHGVEALAREERKQLGDGRGSRNVSTSEPGKMQKVMQMMQNGKDEMVVETVSLALPKELARKLDRIRKRKDFEELLGQFLEGVEAKEEAQKPEAVQTESRHVPAEIERFSRERTGDKCAFPVCMKPIFQLHHTQRWALDHVHDPDRLWGLCQAHNEIAHCGLIENEEGRPETWRMREFDESDYLLAEQAGPALWTAKIFVDRRVQAFKATAVGG